MSFRGTWLHLDSLRALNSIDTVFSKRSDEPIRDAWARVIAHAYTNLPDATTNPAEFRAWNERMFDLRVDLYQLLGAAVGYTHTTRTLLTTSRLNFTTLNTTYPQSKSGLLSEGSLQRRSQMMV
jgi:hypothetical protein